MAVLPCCQATICLARLLASTNLNLQPPDELSGVCTATDELISHAHVELDAFVLCWRAHICHTCIFLVWQAWDGFGPPASSSTHRRVWQPCAGLAQSLTGCSSIFTLRRRTAQGQQMKICGFTFRLGVRCFMFGDGSSGIPKLIQDVSSQGSTDLPSRWECGAQEHNLWE